MMPPRCIHGRVQCDRCDAWFASFHASVIALAPVTAAMLDDVERERQRLTAVWGCETRHAIAGAIAEHYEEVSA